MFARATRKQSKLRLAIDGPAGAGKTYTALRIAHVIAAAEGGRVAVLNTESGAVQKYVGEAPDGVPWDFDVATLDSFSPASYTEAITEAGRMGYAVLAIDSLSHAWDGVGGSLDQVDRNKSDNKFAAWKDVTPQHRRMIEAILRAKPHVIATLRTKMEYVLEENERGKKVPRKIGMKPIQREGMEYEFDVYADIDADHVLTVAKSRCSAVDGYTAAKPGRPFAESLLGWVQSGEQVRPEDERPAPAEPVRPRPPLLRAPQQPQVPQPTSPAAPAIAAAPTRPAALASPELVARLAETADALGMPPEAREAACVRRGARRFEDLAADAAADMLARMRGLLDEKRAAELGISPEAVEQARGPVRETAETHLPAPAAVVAEAPDDGVPF